MHIPDPTRVAAALASVRNTQPHPASTKATLAAEVLALRQAVRWLANPASGDSAEHASVIARALAE